MSKTGFILSLVMHGIVMYALNLYA